MHTGTLICALARGHSGGSQVVGKLPDGRLAMAGGTFPGLPVAAFMVLAVSLALKLVTECSPLGRALFVLGASRKAAQRNGIAVRRQGMCAFVASGLPSGFAGVLPASGLQIGRARLGLEFLLPALVAAFLGSTIIRPGRANVWARLTGVAILAISIAGIQQVGGAFGVKPLVNRFTARLSSGIAGWARPRRKLSTKRRIAQRQLAADGAPEAPSAATAYPGAPPQPPRNKRLTSQPETTRPRPTGASPAPCWRGAPPVLPATRWPMTAWTPPKRRSPGPR